MNFFKNADFRHESAFFCQTGKKSNKKLENLPINKNICKILAKRKNCDIIINVSECLGRVSVPVDNDL